MVRKCSSIPPEALLSYNTGIMHERFTPEGNTINLIDSLTFDSFRINQGISVDTFFKIAAVMAPHANILIHTAVQDNELRLIYKNPPQQSDRKEVIIMTDRILSSEPKAKGRRTMHQANEYLAFIERPSAQIFDITMSTRLTLGDIKPLIGSLVMHQQGNHGRDLFKKAS